jgi:hypothetical protein
MREDGQSIYLSVQDSTEISAIKKEIYKQISLPEENQLLLYRGTEMKDGERELVS